MKKNGKEYSKAEKKLIPNKQSVLMLPDPIQKKNTADYLVQCRKTLRAFIFISKIMFISGLVLGLGYILVNIAINSWNIGYVSGEPVRDYVSIIGLGLLYFAVGALIAGVIRVTANTMSGKHIKNRTNERVEFDGKILRVNFENARKPWLRTFIEVPLSDADGNQIPMTYDPMTAMMTFRHEMKANEMNKKAESGKKVTSGRIEELILYDYFEPSVHMVLKKAGFHFAEPGDAVQSNPLVLPEDDAVTDSEVIAWADE